MSAQEELENYIDEQFIPLRLNESTYTKFLQLLNAALTEVYKEGRDDGYEAGLEVGPDDYGWR